MSLNKDNKNNANPNSQEDELVWENPEKAQEMRVYIPPANGGLFGGSLQPIGSLSKAKQDALMQDYYEKQKYAARWDKYAGPKLGWSKSKVGSETNVIKESELIQKNNHNANNKPNDKDDKNNSNNNSSWGWGIW